MKRIAVLAVCALANAAALAQTTVYDNSTTALVNGTGKQLFHASGFEYGDEITLGAGDRMASQFQFEYFGLAAGGTFTVRFYDNNGGGTPGKPGDLLYESGATSILADYHKVTVDFTGLSPVTVDDTFIWSVKFDGGSAGLLLYDPPTVGSSFNDFWENGAGGWQVTQIKDGATVIPANFGAKLVTVPEPGTVATLLGGLAMLGVVVYRRRSA
ncbi:MAG: PEP-CTERM sorting domain-containing protein [Verrucomicrobia bacterium]|nr:PEP-CTERM sorting domain-containing protein [Verrucomicrobiota bacterium]